MNPPRWLLQVFWALHRRVHVATGGRIGTRRPAAGRVGTLFLLSRGRRSGATRRHGLFYIEDGSSLVVVGSNAGAPSNPSWWLNLQSTPDAEVDVPGGRRDVRARAATEAERQRLWPRLVRANPDFEEYQRAVTRRIPIVLLEPR